MLSLNSRCTMNEAPLDGEGGRVVFHCDDTAARAAGFAQVELIANAMTDAVMKQFPETRAERAARTFRVTLEEVSS